MKDYRRIYVELFAPPFLTGLWVSFFHSHQGESLVDFLFGVPTFIMFSYLFGIVPAAAYAFAMEFWFRRNLHSRVGLLCTVGWSSFLGCIAGYVSAAIGSELGFLIPKDCGSFMMIGAIVGLLVGFYLAKMQVPNVSL